jgi:hypothetical protein
MTECILNCLKISKSKFMKLCTLQDPNMKMCILVVYPGPSSFPRIMSLKVVYAHLHIRILQCTKFHEFLINHVGEFAMTKCILNCLKISKSKEA